MADLDFFLQGHEGKVHSAVAGGGGRAGGRVKERGALAGGGGCRRKGALSKLSSEVKHTQRGYSLSTTANEAWAVEECHILLHQRGLRVLDVGALCEHDSDKAN